MTSSIRVIEEGSKRQELRRGEKAINAPAGTSVWFNAKPIIPTSDNNGNINNEDAVKVSDISNYITNYLREQSDLTVEQQLAFNALTGNTILTNARNYNVSIDSEVLNKNILDMTEIVNSFRPTEIIKLQGFDGSYFLQFPFAIPENDYYLDKQTGTVSVNVPASLIANENYVQIQIFVPGAVNNDTIY